MQSKAVFLLKLDVFVDRMNSRGSDFVIHTAYNRQLSLHMFACTGLLGLWNPYPDSLCFRVGALALKLRELDFVWKDISLRGQCMSCVALFSWATLVFEFPLRCIVIGR